MTQEVTLFKNMNGNCKVALRSGEVVAFVQANAGGGPGQFFTTSSKLQKELQAAADEGEFGIFVDINEASIDPEAATPLQQLEKKLRAQIMAEMEAKKIDAGTSSVSPEQAQAAIGSTAGAVADGGALSVAQVAAQEASEVVQPAGSASPALSVLEALKAKK